MRYVYACLLATALGGRVLAAAGDVDRPTAAEPVAPRADAPRNGIGIPTIWILGPFFAAVSFGVYIVVRTMNRPTADSLLPKLRRFARRHSVVHSDSMTVAEWQAGIAPFLFVGPVGPDDRERFGRVLHQAMHTPPYRFRNHPEFQQAEANFEQFHRIEERRLEAERKRSSEGE